MPILTKNETPAKGAKAEFELDKTALAAIVSDTYFQDTDNWKSVEMIFKSNPGKQRRVVKFDASNIAETTALASFFISAKARDVFEIEKIVINDFDNGNLVIPRVDIPNASTEFDIDVGGLPNAILWEAVSNNYVAESDGGLTNGSGRGSSPIEYVYSNTQTAVSNGDIDLTFNVGNFPSNTIFGFISTESNSGFCGTVSLGGNSHLVYQDTSASVTGFALANKEFRITRLSNVVRMYHDGVLVYTSSANAFGDIKPVASLDTSGGSLISSTFSNTVTFNAPLYE